MQRQSPPPSRRPARPKRKPRTARQRRPAPSARAAYPPGQAPYLPPGDRPPTRRRKKRRLRPTTIMLLGTGLSMLAVGCCVITLLGGFGLLLASDRVLPGVSSVGVDLGSMTEAKAAQALTDAWVNEGILLRDGERVWAVSPADIGISLDANATAAAAKTWGRSNGGLSGAVRSLVSGVEIDPVLNIDMERLSAYLQNAKADTDIPATNAGVQLVNGQAEATPPENGREMDANATANVMRINAADELADGALDVVMIATFPTVTDATPLVAQANALLSSPFTVEAYDPVTDDRFRWSAPPEVWAAWLSAAPAPDSPTGLSLTMNPAGPAAFLESSSGFADERYINVTDAVTAMQTAVVHNRTSTTARVWHGSTTYTVQPGQTLAAIAEEVGIPYPFIQAENPGVNTDALAVGQVLTLPSKDILIPQDPVPNKRIIVDRGQQHLWAYENSQVVFDWVISTGLPSSPTALGVFQVQSHEINAYADQWNLYMPHFMGFYHPGPNMALMNGFHGFPTRGGGYLLWSGDLGHPVTYGCVLLSLENAEALYNWAEEGVVVEVRT